MPTVPYSMAHVYGQQHSNPPTNPTNTGGASRMHPTFTNPNPFSATPGGHPMPDGIIYQLPQPNGVNQQQQQQHYPQHISAGFHRTLTMPASSGTNTNPTGRRGLPTRPQQSRGQSRPRTNQQNINPNYVPAHHNQHQNGEGVQTPQSEQHTVSHTFHGTPPDSRSRKNSAHSTSGGLSGRGWLQCQSKDCGRTFGSDHDWRTHQNYCRIRNYQTTSGFQCSFIGCPAEGRIQHSGQLDTPENTPPMPVTYTSLIQLFAHEKACHQVIFCVDCQHLIQTEGDGNLESVTESHIKICPGLSNGRGEPSNKYEVGSGLGKALHKGTGGGGGWRWPGGPHQRGKIRYMWVKDLQKVLNGGYDRSILADLGYPERSAEERGEKPGKAAAGDDVGEGCTVIPPHSVSEPLRTAMAHQLMGTLKLHSDFLTDASAVVMELTLEEKDIVRKYLSNMAKLLRIDLGNDGESTPHLGPMSKRGSFSTPEITTSDHDANEMDPSSPPPPAGIAASQLRIASILPRSFPAPQATPSTPEPPTQPQPEPQPTPPPPVVDEKQLPVSAPRRSNTNTRTEEGEPRLETHIPRDKQYTYFVQMMNCCLDAVYDWFINNREVLLEHCECTILNAVANGVGGGDQPEGAQLQQPLTKQQKKRMKKHLAAAAAAAAAVGTQGGGGGVNVGTPRNGGSLTPSSATTDGTPNPPVRLPTVCLLHTVTSATTLTLPRWTHHLRRLVEHDRIPAHIVANKESFSGEIQPVDEVRHAVNKQKEKTDRDLLALVQAARRFCWQLKDWERCRQLDDLYTLLEDAIRLVKEEEGWTDVSGSLRGRRKGRGVGSTSIQGSERRVVVGASGGDGDDDGTGSWSRSGGRGAVRQRSTWPRMLPDQLIE